MKILGLNHIAIATDNIDKHTRIFESIFGLKAGDTQNNPGSKISLNFIDFGNADIEFIQPLDPNSPISKFLEKRGPGIHHFCVLVEDIAAALEELQSRGIKLIDSKPRLGAEGSLIAFIHPDSTGGILIELKEEQF
jgi:methylmalonyl-CoA/ethylmalonyl-CoA epimerase